MVEHTAASYLATLKEVLNCLQDLEDKIARFTIRDIYNIIVEILGDSSGEIVERAWVLESIFLSHVYNQLVELIEKIDTHVRIWEGKYEK